MSPLQEYYDVFCPVTGETNARCATQLDAERSAMAYAKADGQRYLIYHCKVVSEVEPALPSPPVAEETK